MYTIKENITKEYIIKKSKFICKLYIINNEKDAKDILISIKNKYKDATHICFGYVTETNEKYSDDGEPQGTAGPPILDLLKKLEITNVLAVVIRYFGGIKLGASGLIRAYKNSVKDTITNGILIEYKKYKIIKIETDFKNEKILKNITKNLIIIDKTYNNSIIYTIKIEEDKLDNFLNKIVREDVKVL